MPHKLVTEGIASKMLAEYEALNSDLPTEIRLQMALFVLAPKTGMAPLEAVFQRPLGQTFNRHRSWMWWTAMRTSGLEMWWEHMATHRNAGFSMRDCLRALKEQASPEQWELFSDRLGARLFTQTPLLRPAGYSREGTYTKVWTKGGIWDKRNPLTKVIILGEHLEGRDHSYSDVTKALTVDQCRRLETEVHHLISPDASLYPNAVAQAIEYVRRRIPAMLMYKRATTSYKVVAWFFQTRIPHPHGGWMKHDQEAEYPMKRKNDWRWLP